MRTFPLRTLLLALAVLPAFAHDHDWDRWRHRREYHHPRPIVVVRPWDAPVCAPRPRVVVEEPVVVVPAHRPWVQRRPVVAPWMAFGVPVGRHGEVVVRVR